MTNDSDETTKCCVIRIEEDNLSEEDKIRMKKIRSQIEEDNRDKLEEVRIKKKRDGTILQWAVQSGCKEDLELLLKAISSKKFIDRPNNDGRTPLHTAVIDEKDWALKVLLEHGADPNARDVLGKAPLDYKTDEEFKIKLTDMVAKLPKEFSTFLDCEPQQKKKRDEEINAALQEGSVTDDHDSHEDKMKTRAEMYNLLMQNDYRGFLKKIEEDVDSSDGKKKLKEDDVDFYVGKKKLICYVLGEKEVELDVRVEIVNRLLDIGVDPLSCDNGGYDSAVELALRYEQRDLVKRMIGILKKKEKNYDNISFDLLRRAFLMADNIEDHQERENKTMKWLEWLFEIDAIQNVNQRNPRLESKQSAFDLALLRDFERAVLFLLMHGATVNNATRDYVLDVLTPETLTEVLNAAVTFKIVEKEKATSTPETSTKVSDAAVTSGTEELDATFTAILNYELFIRDATKSETEDTDSKTKNTKGETEDTNETDTLMKICQTKHFQHVLSHPLVWALIMAKWSRLRKYNTVYSLLASVWHFVLIGSFTALVWPTSTDKTGSLEIIDERRILKWVVVALCSLNIVVDIGKIFLSLKSQWPLRSKNIILFAIGASAAIKVLIIFICFLMRRRSAISWVVSAAWVNSAISIGLYWKPFNTITTMLWKISWHILKLSVFAVFLVAGFGLGFTLIFWPDQYTNNSIGLADFSSPWTAFPRVFAMATGEFGYDSLRDGLLVDEHTVTSVFNILLFLVFVFLVFLVIMNVMTGVAIVEAQEIKDSAAKNYLMRQLEVAYVIEQLHKKIHRKIKDSAAKNYLMRQLEVAYVIEQLHKTIHRLLKKLLPCKIWPETELLSESPIMKFKSKEEVIQYSTRDLPIKLPSDTAKELRQKLQTLRGEKVAQKEKEEAKMEKEEQRRNMQKLLSRIPVDEAET